MKKTTVLIVGGVALAGAAFWWYTKNKSATAVTEPAADSSTPAADVPKVVGPALTAAMNLVDKTNPVVTTASQAAAVAAVDTKNTANTETPRPQLLPIGPVAPSVAPSSTTSKPPVRTIADVIKERMLAKKAALKGIDCYTMN